jgi:CheY-like chemotaxis protein
MITGSCTPESKGSSVMNRPSNENHCIVSMRLKFVDLLVKAGRYGDAIREITAIKQIEPTHPYVQAYEERLLTIGSPLHTRVECTPAATVEHTASNQNAPASPRIAHEVTTQEFANTVAGHAEEFLLSAERRQPTVIDSSDGLRGSPNPHSMGKAGVVLVDDDELLLMALVELLEDNKYRTKSFTKSEHALEYVEGHKPDLVLCDVNLQGSSFGGFTLFEKMTKIGHLHNVPFIFMSGIVDQAVIRAGKELGADDYLTKPVEPDMLLSVVKGKLRKYKFTETNH